MISVIIPAYNAEKTIKKCLDSILNQTYDDYEIIVVNDGSVDQTSVTLESYKKSVRYYETENHGVSSARNFGLSKAKGDWITFVDSDDWIEKKMFENVIKIINNNTDIVMTNIYYDGPVKKEASYEIKEDIIANKTEILETIIDLYYGEKRYGAKYGNCRCIGGKFYRTDLIKKNKISFDTELTGFEDGVFNLYACQKAKEIMVMKEKLYHYVYNSQSRVATGDSKDECNQYLTILEKIKEFLNNNNIRSQAISYCSINFASAAASFLINNETKVKLLNKKLLSFKTFVRSEYIDTQKLRVKKRTFYRLWKANMLKTLSLIYRLKNRRGG